MYSRTNPAYLCSCSEETRWVMVWGLPGNTNLPSNYLFAMQMDSIAYLAGMVTWMWTFTAAVSHLCRSYTPTLLSLSSSQNSLACCFISEWPLLLFHRSREKTIRKFSYVYRTHPRQLKSHQLWPFSLCPLLTCSLHCNPMCFRGKSTYICCLGYSVGQIRCLSACQKCSSEQTALGCCLFNPRRSHILNTVCIFGCLTVPSNSHK